MKWLILLFPLSAMAADIRLDIGEPPNRFADRYYIYVQQHGCRKVQGLYVLESSVVERSAVVSIDGRCCTSFSVFTVIGNVMAPAKVISNKKLENGVLVDCKAPLVMAPIANS